MYFYYFAIISSFFLIVDVFYAILPSSQTLITYQRIEILKNRLSNVVNIFPLLKKSMCKKCTYNTIALGALRIAEKSQGDTYPESGRGGNV